MAIKPRWSSQPDENFGFGEGGGSWYSPFEVDQYWIGVVFMVGCGLDMDHSSVGALPG